MKNGKQLGLMIFVSSLLFLCACQPSSASSSIEESASASESESSISSEGLSSSTQSASSSIEESSSAPESESSISSEESSSSTHAHTYGDQWISAGESGHYRECTVCGEHSATEPHTFGEWVIEHYPTADKKGQKSSTCSACGFTAHAEIAELDGFAISIYLGDKLFEKVYTDAEGHYSLSSPSLGEGVFFAGYKNAAGDYVSKDGVVSAHSSFFIQTSDTVYPAADLAALKAGISFAVPTIQIVADISITETIYVDYPLTLISQDNVTITRSVDFAGDLFVIGEDANQNKSIVAGRQSSLTVSPAEGKTIVFDGNKEAIDNSGDMAAKVSGSAFFVCASGELNLGEGVKVQNCKKVDNSRVYRYASSSSEVPVANEEAQGDEDQDSEKYLSSPNRIGGAAICNIFSVVNIEGAEFIDNEVNDSADVEDYLSAIGGSIYNCGTVNINGGTFTGGKGTYGSAIYSHRILNIRKANISGNHAYKYGAVYLANSQYAECRIDSEDKTNVCFSDNSAQSGGGIFATTLSSVYIDGATFDNNEAVNNGAAIACKGVLTVLNSEFKSNTCGSKGGAIYAYYGETDESQPSRNTKIVKTAFKNNTGSLGGAVGFGNDSEQDPITKFPIGHISECEFSGNQAVLNASGKYGHGGALYMQNSSLCTIGKTVFDGNSAVASGGVAYVNSKAKVILQNNCQILNNIAKNGGGIYLTEEAFCEATDLLGSGNSATNNGGLFYVYTSAKLIGTRITASSNIADNYGGFMYGSGASESRFTEIVSSSNSAVQGGFIYITTTGTTFYLYSGSSTGCAASNAGPNLYSNTNKTKIYIDQTAFTTEGDLAAGKFVIGDIPDENQA